MTNVILGVPQILSSFLMVSIVAHCLSSNTNGIADHYLVRHEL